MLQPSSPHSPSSMVKGRFYMVTKIITTTHPFPWGPLSTWLLVHVKSLKPMFWSVSLPISLTPCDFSCFMFSVWCLCSVYIIKGGKPTRIINQLGLLVALTLGIILVNCKRITHLGCCCQIGTNDSSRLWQKNISHTVLKKYSKQHLTL